MKIEVMTRNQVTKMIKDFHSLMFYDVYKEINKLYERILKLEEEVKILKKEGRKKHEKNS